MRLTGYLKVAKNVPVIFGGVKLYKAVYNLQLYSLLGLSEVAVLPLGSCLTWKSYEYPFTTFPGL